MLQHTRRAYVAGEVTYACTARREYGGEMITVQLQEADYLAAVKLHRRKSKQMLFILCYTVGGILFFLYTSPREMYMVYLLFGVAAFLSLFMVWMHFIGVPWGARRRFRQQKDLVRQYAIDWNDEKLTIDGDDLHVGIPWTDFLKWTEDDQVFLLYSSRLLFRMYPKRCFPHQAAVADFARLLSEKIGPVDIFRK